MASFTSPRLSTGTSTLWTPRAVRSSRPLPSGRRGAGPPSSTGRSTSERASTSAASPPRVGSRRSDSDVDGPATDRRPVQDAYPALTTGRSVLGVLEEVKFAARDHHGASAHLDLIE